MGGAGETASDAGGTEGAGGSEGAGGGGTPARGTAVRGSAGRVGGVVTARGTPARGAGGTRRTPSGAEGVAEPHAHEALVGSARTLKLFFEISWVLYNPFWSQNV